MSKMDNKPSSDEQIKKNRRLLGYWLLSTFLVTFAALTTFIFLWAKQTGGGVMYAITSGFPIWGIVAGAAILIYLGYYFYSQRK